MNFKLSLANSSKYFATLNHPFSKKTVIDTYAMPIEYRKFPKHHCELTDIDDFELRKANRLSEVHPESTTCKEVLIQLSARVHDYLSASAGSYLIGTEERSLMILTIMWMWMIMDKALSHLFPALSYFKPIFQSSILDCLRL
ncbi:uncharacterized protein A1O9_07711 [Exophiala aquamarina CBS 119918]|uniref:Uncharacterized protein n=1 Tax=Exophiala aquamarina CBS 119918 TaxID=1182545 RepID=A0A072PKT6_9EURO|nr:uncharacterized protein A1O9_07711 [Exophiala aquamarina CBS 119918]KEF56130.1 hypothetical protein A1O9_07711 [Exophiala aquamarina CBS 119918]